MTRLKIFNNLHYIAAVEFFQRQLSSEAIPWDSSDILVVIPDLFTRYNNDLLKAILSYEEVKDVVFVINLESAAGPHGLTTHFYQFCWDVMDVYNVTIAFFKG